MKINNATIAYFIVEEPRLDTEEFNNTVSEALQNGLKVYGPSEGFGNGKLYVFYYTKQSEENLYSINYFLDRARNFK